MGLLQGLGRDGARKGWGCLGKEGCFRGYRKGWADTVGSRHAKTM